MKKVLALVTVIALMASISSATTTLNVWTTLVSATPTWNTQHTAITGYVFGTTPVTRGPNMATGYYGVQMWAQILGGTAGWGISDMAVTLYTPDTNGCFQSVAAGSTVYTSVGMELLLDGYNTPKALNAHAGTNNTGGVANTGTDKDAVQFSTGDTGYAAPDLGVGSPVLLATEAWNLTSLGTSGVNLSVYVAPTSRYWNAIQTQSDLDNSVLLGAQDKLAFDSIVGTGMVIPEPITMTMLAMGLSGLGIMIRRRTKETTV